jgi:hypothetical protein
MVNYCNNDDMLRMYKRVLKSLVNKYPETVEYYVRLYYEEWEPEKIGLNYDDDGGE